MWLRGGSQTDSLGFEDRAEDAVRLRVQGRSTRRLGCSVRLVDSQRHPLGWDLPQERARRTVGSLIRESPVSRKMVSVAGTAVLDERGGADEDDGGGCCCCSGDDGTG